MSDINFNTQGDVNIGGDVAGGNITKNIFEAAPPLALSLHQLPAPPADFTGREDELEKLRAALKTGGVTISGLHGLGGVGKTALALKLAQELLAAYPDAQFYIDLRGAAEQEPLTPAQAQAHIIRAYYPQNKLPEDNAQLNALYHSVLNGQRALLVLDNAHNAAQVALLLPPPGSLTLLTSRQNFAVPGLRAFPLDTLKPEEAEALIFRIAERLGSGDEGVKGSVQKIAELCGYLPLAVRAAASLLAETIDLDPAKYAKDLESETARLELTGLKAEGVPISVQASLNLSYKNLDEKAQKVLRGLSVFPDDFDAPAAEFVCEDEGHQHLSLLLRWSLADYKPALTPSPSPGGRGGGRYRLHDLTRAYARVLGTDEERAHFSLRHAEHYADIFGQCNQLLLSGREKLTRGLALFDLEQRNIFEGQDWSQENFTKDERAAKACNWYGWQGSLLSLRFHPRERIEWMEAALVAARQLKHREAEGAHLGNLGLAHAALGDARKAIEYHEQALVIDREIGDRRGEGADLGNLGLAHAALGDARKAIEYHEQCLILHREIGDRRGEGADLGNLGSAHADLGDARKAIEFYEQALVIDREIGDRRGEGAALGNLGLAHAALGDARKAIEFYEQRLVIAREIGDRRGEGNALGNLGIAYKNLGDARKAIEFYEQQLVIVREIGDRRGEGAALGNLGNAHAALGDARKAIEFYEQQLVIVREIGDRRGEGNSTYSMALALDSLGERAQAIPLAEAALKIYEAIEDPNAEKVRKQLAEWRKQ